MFSSKVLKNSQVHCKLTKFFRYSFLNLHSAKISSSNYASLVSSESPNTKRLEFDESSADTFGTLSKRRTSKYGARTVPISNRDVKVVKVKAKPKSGRYHESNVFGNLSDKEPIWYPDLKEESVVDNDLSDDGTIVKNISKHFRNPKVYLENMKLLVSEKKLKEALDLFLDMRRNYVAPTKGHYTFMIGACGKAGYTDMAFKLLRQMTDRKFTPTPATLTGIFNSCAESPFPEFGLKKATAIREKIKAKNWYINQITYNAMIKAFGKCGDIQTAFQIVDEMAKEDIKIDVSTFSFLLMSCASNKEAGFTLAVEVWRKMKEKSIKPSVFSYNLLLRSVRDCDVGPKEISCLLLQHWSSFGKRPYGFERKQPFQKAKETLQLESAGTVDVLPESLELADETIRFTSNEDKSSSLQNRDTNSAVTRLNFKVQNLLAARPVNGAEVLEIADLKTASDRLALIGKAQGFLSELKRNCVLPNIKTFTLLLECLPPCINEEEELMNLLDVYNVKPDVGFFNVLIKRRSFRFDHVEASKVLLLLHKWSLTPDIITYGCLALGCDSQSKAEIFIADMRKLGLCPNTNIVGSLMSQACTAADFEYIENTLELMSEEKIKPNERMLLKIEATIKKIRSNIFDMENGHPVPNVYKKEGFCSRFKEFCKIYEQWLKSINFDKEEHVWEQYKTRIF